MTRLTTLVLVSTCTVLLAASAFAERERTPVSPEQAARVEATAGSLIAALNNAKKPAFKALFNAHGLGGEDAGVDGMVDFMEVSRGVHGDIVSLHPLGDQAVIIAESAYPMSPMVFHLADGMPGYFGIALDEAGLIDYFSLYVLEKICAEGKDCTKTVPLGG